MISIGLCVGPCAVRPMMRRAPLVASFSSALCLFGKAACFTRCRCSGTREMRRKQMSAVVNVGAGGIKFIDEVTGELEIRGVRTL